MRKTTMWEVRETHNKTNLNNRKEHCIEIACLSVEKYLIVEFICKTI